jgi:hypothetical protein
MSESEPVWIGSLDAVRRGDIVDRYIDVSAELEGDETVTDAALTLADGDGAQQENAVSGISPPETGGRVDFRITVPGSAGSYRITAVFTISDGQRITRTCGLPVV